MPSQIKVDEIKNVAGQYEIKTNTFKGQTTAGSIAVQGEGTATTNLQQGLCKAWISFDGSGTISTYDSFNIGSLTDVGTGDYGYTYANNMNAKHPLAGSCIGSLESNNYSFACSSGDALTTAGTNFQFRHHASTVNDQDPVSLTAHGDLA